MSSGRALWFAMALAASACAPSRAPAPDAAPTVPAAPAARAPAPATEAPPAPAPAPRERVIFSTVDGDLSVAVEVAITPSQRARGLMHRDALADGDGMIFVFGRRADHAFWMKNTRIPLDMVFVDGSAAAADLRVVGVVHAAEPHTLIQRRVGAPSFLVVEVPGGWCRSHGVDTGTLVRLDGFRVPEPR